MAESVCKSLATKVLKQRPGTVKRASDASLLFVELEQSEAMLVGQPCRLSAFPQRLPATSHDCCCCFAGTQEAGAELVVTES